MTDFPMLRAERLFTYLQAAPVILLSLFIATLFAIEHGEIIESAADFSMVRRERIFTDLQGATFTISSLGGIGGTGFTPIVNAPQVAILGLSRSYMKPVWNGDTFEPRLTLPFSLSYDHRVIDGASGAAFLADFKTMMEEPVQALY